MSSLEINHIHGGYEIYNNFVSNLEWCTTKENIEKSIETGLRHSVKGSTHHATFLIEEDVIQICKCIETGLNALDTYNTINLSVVLSFKHFKQNYYNIKYHNSWKFISEHYNF